MAAVTIRNIPAETHRALKARAKRHGRSTEAEIRAILDAAVTDQQRVRIGSALAALGREAGGFDLDIQRSQVEPEPADFS